MCFKQWEELPEFMKNEAVKRYYEILSKKRFQLKIKRFFDVMMSSILIVLLSPMFIAISLWIKLDSEGPVFYKQKRITQYGRNFYIFKFRTMVVNADQMGALITKMYDPRITKAGEKMRKLRIDELPQLFNIFRGDMSFVGTRPEVERYVMAYTEEMKATLLLPAGVTSKASIEFRNENVLLNSSENTDEVYIQKILPEKMKWNLKSLEKFSLYGELYVMLQTIYAVIL